MRRKSIPGAVLTIFVCGITALPAVSAQRRWHEIASFSTSFVSGQESRNHNIRLAASILNGHIVNAGQVFSFNDTIGQRSLDRGFLKAPSIEFGQKLNAEGGGICLVSSVLYRNALIAGMEIVERHPHSRPVRYILPGSDATVDFGMKDLKFKNPLSQPVQIETSIIGTRLVIRLLSSAVLPYETHLTSTQAFQNDGTVRVQTSRTCIQNGRPIASEVISDDLYPTERPQSSQERRLQGGLSFSN